MPKKGSRLFAPLQLGPITLKNRIAIPPMCQYSAHNGEVRPWHEMHYGHLAVSGASLLVLEATSVVPEGRISPSDLGLWNDQQAQGLAQLLASIRTYSDIKIGVQLAHAGRKASTAKAWEGQQYLTPDQGGWVTQAPSAIAFTPNSHEQVHALTLTEIQDIQTQFVQAALRAQAAGFDVIELHAAHGYLMHEFLSPLCNQRHDEYGGSLANRCRFVLEIFQKVRQALDSKLALGVRISATDWVDGGWDLQDSIYLAQQLAALGCHFIDVSSAGAAPEQQIEVGPGYQVPFAQALKQALNIPVIAVGLITDGIQAEHILRTEQADMVDIGRAILYNPRWPWQAAADLGEQIDVAPQYLRCAPYAYKHLFKAS
ncbi:NADH:flavin oxidoreductase/NADH oxidase [Brackiella oedipodis]|uniref:NADH:flavin oxidoreductase/NADH oxidase n=1 Tax=Brackiella oedipodis TaxID=124225 RepID=UPI0004911D26|nr:NADH:flavin oxidoreductase/NADH oxidase [Brackiella oedipodis]